jgi:hypothetical protein
VIKLEHNSHPPDLASADFYLFAGMKSAWKGRRICDTTDIIKNATEELKRHSQNGLQGCFQHIYSRWQKCTVAQAECFEGKCILNYCSVLYFPEIKLFWIWHKYTIHDKRKLWH